MFEVRRTYFSLRSSRGLRFSEDSSNLFRDSIAFLFLRGHDLTEFSWRSSAEEIMFCELSLTESPADPHRECPWFHSLINNARRRNKCLGQRFKARFRAGPRGKALPQLHKPASPLPCSIWEAPIYACVIFSRWRLLHETFCTRARIAASMT